MPGSSVQVRGADELARALRRFPEDLDGDLDAVEDRAAQEAARRVSSAVPRRSGALAASVSATNGQLGMGDGLPYAGWIEYGGTRNRPYIPTGRYVMPSALSVADAFHDDCARQAGQTIRSYPWPRAPL